MVNLLLDRFKVALKALATAAPRAITKLHRIVLSALSVTWDCMTDRSNEAIPIYTALLKAIMGNSPTNAL